jgi:hypothetical protein
MLSLVLFLQGCLTIEENYTFKKDGSGTMEYVVDMSEMAEMLKGFPGAKDNKDDGSGKMDMSARLDMLKGLPGIKKVKLKKEKDGFIQRMSFRFEDVASLNGALNVLMPDSGAAPHEFFRWEGNTLVRTTNDRMKGVTGGMGGGTDDTTDVSGILKMMRYKFDLRFADELGDVQVAEGVLKEADGTKRMKLSTDWSVIDKDSTALDLRITLKR